MNSFTDYSHAIAESAKVLDDYLLSSRNAMPSARLDSPQRFPHVVPDEVRKARIRLIETSRELTRLAMWPEEASQGILEHSIQINGCMRVMVDFNVFDAIPKEPGSSANIQDLAKTCGINNKANQLGRIVERLKIAGVLDIPQPGSVAHTAISLMYITGGAFENEAKWFTSIVAEASNSLSAALKELGDADPDRSNGAFNKAFATKDPVMQWMNQHEDWTKVFSGVMDSYVLNDAFRLEHAANVYDWASLGKAHVVDVGGNAGMVARTIAKAAPELHFTVQDQSKPILLGRSKLPSEFEGRISFQEHDFFTRNPVHEPEVFMFRWILHDWPDSEARKIIRGVSDQMGPRTKLFIIDGIAARQETDYESTPLADLDIIMMSLFNGLERNAMQWESLFTQADPALKLVRTHQTPGSALALMEVVKT